MVARGLLGRTVDDALNGAARIGTRPAGGAPLFHTGLEPLPIAVDAHHEPEQGHTGIRKQEAGKRRFKDLNRPARRREECTKPFHRLHLHDYRLATLSIVGARLPRGIGVVWARPMGWCDATTVGAPTIREGPATAALIDAVEEKTRSYLDPGAILPSLSAGSRPTERREHARTTSSTSDGSCPPGQPARCPTCG